MTFFHTTKMYGGEADDSGWAREHAAVNERVAAGDLMAAASLLEKLADDATTDRQRALLQNDRGVLYTLQQHWREAQNAFRQALHHQPGWDVPQRNLFAIAKYDFFNTRNNSPKESPSRTRIGILSLLFNWPSTGGGTIHTAETARFLTRAGYDIRHWVIRYPGWSVGQITEPVDWPVEFLDFTDDTWRRSDIQQCVKTAVDAFQPAHVIVTDSWNFKPCLAEALHGHSYFLRLAAQECLCPLSNVRLLSDGQGGWRSCPQHQLATPSACQICVRERFALSGSLHRAERALAGFEQADYVPRLHHAFADAAGILVVNPLIAEAVKPYARAVHVIPSGFDAERFSKQQTPQSCQDGCLRIVFAGLVDEPMKGFAILRSACRQLWETRQDFRLVVTADALSEAEPFVTCVGWRTQAELPLLLQQCDLVACPTVAEEALGRTAVEGMAAGRPVVASRLGGLPFTVLEEATGLLCQPGDVQDLVRKLTRLLDDEPLRRRFGAAGRQRFFNLYTWDAILPHYRKLLGPSVSNSV